MIGMQLSGGQFQITAKLGEGGFASVFRGTQKTPQRDVAIKVLHASLANQPSVVTRFHHEAQTLARFDHPHIMKIYFEGEDQGLHYFVAQLLREDLRGRLDGGSPPDAREALRILRQISDALDYMHRKGFIHRDFKPANILFDENQNAVLTDFGLARGHDLTLVTQQGMILGTAAYMAPEQIQPGPGGVDARADLYALGCVMFELLEGKPPFPVGDFFATCHSHLYDPAPPLSSPGLPENLKALVASLLSKKPEDRPETAEVVLEEIVAAEHELNALLGPAKRNTARPATPPGARPASSAGGSPGPAAPPPVTPAPATPAPGGADQWSMAVPAPEIPRQSVSPQIVKPITVPVTPPPVAPPPPPPPSLREPVRASAPDPTSSVEETWASLPASSLLGSTPSDAPAEARIGAGPRRVAEPGVPARPGKPSPAIPPPATTGGRRVRVPMLAGLVVLGLAIAGISQWMGRRAHEGAVPTGSAGASPAAAAGQAVGAQGTVVLLVDPANALANLDGKPLPGLEPYSIALPPGRSHTVEVALTGYRGETRQIRTREGAVDTLRVSLQRAAEIAEQAPATPAAPVATAPTSQPAGGKTAGNVPASQPAPAPPHRAAGRGPRGGGETPAPAGTGSLNVASVGPSGLPLPASVALDGHITGEQTPCVLEELSADVHLVRVGKSGYHVQSATLDDAPAVIDGEEVEIKILPGRALHLRVVLTKD